MGAEPLTALTKALVRAGHCEAALELSRTITHPAERARALGVVAYAYGPTARGRALLAESSAVGPWTSVVPGIARVEATALEALRCCVQATC